MGRHVDSLAQANTKPPSEGPMTPLRLPGPLATSMYRYIYIYIDFSTVAPNSDASACGRGVFVDPVFGPCRSIVHAHSELFN